MIIKMARILRKIVQYQI